MSALHSTTHSTRKPYRRPALIWLLMFLLLSILTALVWMFSQTETIGTRIENAPIALPQVSVDELKQPLSIAALHELDTDIQPIDFEATVRDLRNYPAEFKDKRYLLANKGKWTVQVMNVAENDVIVSYLESRDDRAKFSYFRYHDEDDQMRYMLIYGVMGSIQEAIGAAKLTDFGLPTDVRVLPEKINRYVGVIDNYERPEPIKDLSTNRTRSVTLQPTTREVPVRQQTEEIPTSDDNAGETGNLESTENTNNQVAPDNNGNAESIRKSTDTSDTLSVNEDRTVDTADSPSSAKEDKTRKADSESKKPAVAPTPKPPNKAEKSGSSSEGNNDTIKALIEEKSN